MTLPTYRHSDFSTHDACPFAYACRLLSRVLGSVFPGQDELNQDALADELGRYTSTDGAEWIIAHCASVASPLQNPITQTGVVFHQFAHAYGEHCKRENIRSDWERGATMAHGMACIDGQHWGSVAEIMTNWMQSWEYSPVPEGEDAEYIPLVTGGFETSQQLVLETFGRKVCYVWHPDYARLSADGTTLELWDWKSGMKTDTYKPEWPDTQLLRYAWGFKRLFRDVRHVRMEIRYVRPEHPHYNDPHVWERDLEDRPIDDSIITGPIEAIRARPEFPAHPGCWLCVYCEWVRDCPSGPEVQRMLDEVNEDPRAILAQHDQLGDVQDHVRARRSALKKALQWHVEQHGPIRVSDGDPETGQLATEYGGQRELRMTIDNMDAFLADATAKGHHVTDLLKVPDKAALAMRVGVADNPWADEGAVAGLSAELAAVYGVHDVGTPDDVIPQEYGGEPEAEAPRPVAGDAAAIMSKRIAAAVSEKKDEGRQAPAPPRTREYDKSLAEAL